MRLTEAAWGNLGRFFVGAPSPQANPARRHSVPTPSPLVAACRRPHAPAMFLVSETEAAAIRAAFEQGGELSAAVELRRLL